MKKRMMRYAAWCLTVLLLIGGCAPAAEPGEPTETAAPITSGTTVSGTRTAKGGKKLDPTAASGGEKTAASSAAGGETVATTQSAVYTGTVTTAAQKTGSHAAVTTAGRSSATMGTTRPTTAPAKAFPAGQVLTGKKEIRKLTCLTGSPQALHEVEFEAEINLPNRGNVYDDNEISVVMTAVGPEGQKLSVIGFYYIPYPSGMGVSLANTPGEPTWRFRFSPPTPGYWTCSVKVEWYGVSYTPLTGFRFWAYRPSDTRGILSVEPNHKQTFRFENGKDFVAIGQNVAWSNGGNAYSFYAQQIQNMSKNGCNFMRMWLAPWDLALITGGKQPDDLSGGMYRAAMIDEIVKMAEQYDIYIELCIFQHGQFSTIADANWHGNPYNANAYPGTGYLNTPAEFFRNADAKEDAQDYLRYIVARWGYSTHIMSWQLFNEADLAESNEMQMYQWHQTMCAYLREIDWQHHMVVTSTAGRTGVSALPCFDYMCGHWYGYGKVSNLCNTESAYYAKFKKPYLFDELGQGNLDASLISIHQQNWAGLMGGSGGVGVNWFWSECTYIPGYYASFKPVADFAKRIPWSDPGRKNYGTSSLRDNESQVITVGYGGKKYAYLWAFDDNFNNDKRTTTTFASYSVTVPLESGTYKATWIDPWTGSTVLTKTVRVTGKKVALQAPPFDRDILVAVEKS